jgi:hypothetical protein
VQDGIGAAFGTEIPAEYFSAIYDNQTEAEARYSIYQAHCQMNRTGTHGEQPAN